MSFWNKMKIYCTKEIKKKKEEITINNSNNKIKIKCLRKKELNKQVKIERNLIFKKIDDDLMSKLYFLILLNFYLKINPININLINLFKNK